MDTERRRYRAHEISDAVKGTCRELLFDLKRHIPGLVSTGVVGPDGFEVAAIATLPLEIAKVAALTSTLVAVAEAFSLECGLESCRELILDNSSGCTLVLSIPVMDANYALFVIAGNAATLGLVLSRARMCTAEIREALIAGFSREHEE